MSFLKMYNPFLKQSNNNKQNYSIFNFIILLTKHTVEDYLISAEKTI